MKSRWSALSLMFITQVQIFFAIYKELIEKKLAEIKNWESGISGVSGGLITTFQDIKCQI